MKNTKLAKMLTIGMIGSICVPLALVIVLMVMVSMVSLSSGMVEIHIPTAAHDSATTIMTIMVAFSGAALLILFGFVLQGIGFFGLEKLFGKPHAAAGIVSFVISVIVIVSIIGALFFMGDDVQQQQRFLRVMSLLIVGLAGLVVPVLAAIGLLSAGRRIGTDQRIVRIGAMSFLSGAGLLLVNLVVMAADLNSNEVEMTLSTFTVIGLIVGHSALARTFWVHRRRVAAES